MVSRAVLCLLLETQSLQQDVMAFPYCILKPCLQQTASSFPKSIMYGSAAWLGRRAAFSKLGGARQSCKGFSVLV